MLTTSVTNRNEDTTAFHIAAGNSRFPVFSSLKVRAVISEAITSNAEPNTDKQGLFHRVISIYYRVKGVLTPSKKMCVKIKPLFLVVMAILSVIVIQALTVGILLPIFLAGVAGFVAGSLLLAPTISINVFTSYYTFCNIILNGFSSIHNKIIDDLMPEPSLGTNLNTDNILSNISHLASILDTQNKDDEPDIPMLFQLIHEIQDLSFMSGTKCYDKLRKTFTLYLKTHQECFDPLLQHVMEQDKNKLRTMLKDINGCEHLSLTQMEIYYAALKESTNTPEAILDTQQFKETLACKLLLDLPFIHKEITNASDAIRRLTRIKREESTETIDQPPQAETETKTETDKIEDQESNYSINTLVDKLHYISCLCSLLNSCYPSLHSTQKISQVQYDELTKCDKTYQNLRSQLLNLCSNPDDNIPKIWAIDAMARQLNRTWIERYRNQPNHHEGAINPVQTVNRSPVSLKNFDDVDHTDNIILFDLNNNLYSLNTQTDCTTAQSAREHISLSTVRPSTNSIIDHHLNIIPLDMIINMGHFTIENILPAALPLDFIKP